MGRVGLGAWLGLAGCLLIPVGALLRQAAVMDWRLLLGIPCLASAAAYVAYGLDKQRAEAGEWRISEATLHALEMLGGWPGGFLAQRRFRHKISKPSYLAVFWLTVALHHLLAVDSLLGWKYTRMLLRAAN
jgi:uncharacterized membrane protein YsdA (DUF1294 family)